MSASESDAYRRHFDRPTEKMILESIRLWSHGQALKSSDTWTHAQHIYRNALGDAMGEQAIIALARFIAVLGRCASCPLRTFPAPAAYVSHDETLMLGLVAGIQNSDQAAIDFCLEGLCCPSLCEEVSSAAAVFALTMRACNNVMRPIPVPTLKKIISTSGGKAGGSDRRTTLH